MMLREMRDLFSYHSGATARSAAHDVQNVFEKTLRDLRQLGFGELEGRKVLDLGCGQRFPFALQCAAAGARVTALDVNYIVPDALPLAFLRTMRQNGLKRAAKSAVRRLLWDKHYYRELERFAGRPLRANIANVAFLIAEAADGRFPLPSESFDLIDCNAVLEHVRDVAGFAGEVARLLETGGYFYAIVHNFFSVSGGHNPEWAFPDERPSRNVPPWDHLRANRFPPWTYLNRLRPHEYKDAFAKHLQVLRFEGVGIEHDPGQPEGEALLTSEIAAELKSYPRELLLTRSWCVVCKKV